MCKKSSLSCLRWGKAKLSPRKGDVLLLLQLHIKYLSLHLSCSPWPKGFSLLKAVQFTLIAKIHPLHMNSNHTNRRPQHIKYASFKVKRPRLCGGAKETACLSLVSKSPSKPDKNNFLHWNIGNFDWLIVTHHCCFTLEWQIKAIAYYCTDNL